MDQCVFTPDEFTSTDDVNAETQYFFAVSRQRVQISRWIILSDHKKTLANAQMQLEIFSAKKLTNRKFLVYGLSKIRPAETKLK